MQILIGTDPEVFVRDAAGKYFSVEDKAHGKLIPGTKFEPHRVNSGAIQRDGVALEFNTIPASTSDEFLTYIEDVMKQMEATFKSIRPDLEIVMTPTATFDREYFDALPEEVKLLGCTPDYNAYTGKENEPPSTDEPFRTGSGHLHIGWTRWENPHDEAHFDTCMALVRQLDCILYPASLLWDDDDKRRTLYGKIGAFRPKEYGVEYRPLSNAYLSSKKTQKYVFDVAMKAASDFFDGILYFDNDYAKEMVSSVRDGLLFDRGNLDLYLGRMFETFGVPVYE
jgi:hypothetical protein